MGESFLDLLKFDAVMWLGRSGYGRFHRGKIQFQHIRVFRIAITRIKKTHFACTGFHNAGLVCPVSHFEIIHGFLIYREKTHGGAVFWRHVGDGGPVRHG